MLNLRPIFQDAIDVLSRHAARLKVRPLPATVYLLQRDVINHYRYAATHYLTLSLSEDFLQNSSLGSPYEKWAYFTNMDFDSLSFTLTNLMRYTARLVYETETMALRADRRTTFGASRRCDSYIGPLVEITHKNRQVGVRVNSDETLTVTPFATDHGEVFGTRAAGGGRYENFQIVRDADGNEQERIITQAEVDQLMIALREHKIDLGDRSVLWRLQAESLAECYELERLNDQFGQICNAFGSQGDVAIAFDCLHPEWCD